MNLWNDIFFVSDYSVSTIFIVILCFLTSLRKSRDTLKRERKSSFSFSTLLLPTLKQEVLHVTESKGGHSLNRSPIESTEYTRYFFIQSLRNPTQKHEVQSSPTLSKAHRRLLPIHFLYKLTLPINLSNNKPQMDQNPLQISFRQSYFWIVRMSIL